MKTTLSKIKLGFLLTLLATIICCTSIAFAGIFGAKNSVASADEISETTEESSEETAEKVDNAVNSVDETPSDTDADGSGATDNATVYLAGNIYTYDYSSKLDGKTCKEQAERWEEAIWMVKDKYYTVLITLEEDWIAEPVNGTVNTNSESGPQGTSFTGSFDNSGVGYHSQFHYGSIAIQCARVILDLKGHKIDRNLSQESIYGSVFYMDACSGHRNSELTIVDSVGGGKITGGNRAHGAGGGIYMYDRAKLTLDGGSITGNRAHSGGGVYVKGSSEFKMNGGSITNNTSVNHTDGGGVFVESGANKFTMTGGTISNNHATYDGGGIMNFGQFNMTGGTIVGNYCINSNEDYAMCPNWNSGDGGGIYNAYGATCTISGGVISANKAGQGGGIWSSGSLNMSGSLGGRCISISANTSYNGGGGISAEGNLDITGVIVSGNLAQSNTETNIGAGIYCNGVLKMNECTVADNYVYLGNRRGGGIYCSSFDISNSSIVNNAMCSGGIGGGIYSWSTAVKSYFRSGEISGNKAGHYGGGIFASGNLDISGGTISRNYCSDEKAVDSMGGGVYCRNTVQISGGAVISENYCYGYGGGVFAPTVVMYDGTVVKNAAKNPSDDNHGENGGGICCSSFTMTGGVISENYAHHGGGVYVGGYSLKNPFNSNEITNTNSGTKCTITGGVFQSNYTYSGGFGGAVYACVDNQVITVSGCEFKSNEAENSGGALYIQDTEGTVNIYSCNFDTNYTPDEGGAAKIFARWINIGGADRGNTFIGNYVEADNGDVLALHNYSSYSGSIVTFQENVFSANGDGYAQSAVFLERYRQVTMNGDVVSYNNGNGIHFDNCYEVSLQNCTFNGNNSAGIYAEDGNITMRTCTVNSNGKGGVYVAGNSSLEMINCTVRDNLDEAGVLVTSNVDLTLDGGFYKGTEDHAAIDKWGVNTVINISGAIHIDGSYSSPFSGYNADILNIVGSLQSSWDEGHYGAASIVVDHFGTITEGYSKYNRGISPSTFFHGQYVESEDKEVWLLNGEVFVGKQPRLIWQINSQGGRGGTAWTGVVTVVGGESLNYYEGSYSCDSWALRANYASGEYKTITYYKDGIGEAISQSDVKNVGTYVCRVSDATSEWANPEFTLVITKRQITEISGVTVTNKTYDGTTAATVDVSKASFTGKPSYSADELTLCYTSATFNNADAGTGKTVTLNGLTLGGAAAENYELASSVTVTATGDITKYKTMVDWTDTSLMYNEKAQGPKASYKTIDGKDTELTTIGGTFSSTAVGTYTAEATAPANYEFLNAECEWEITKATPKVNAKVTGADGLQVGDSMPEIATTAGDTAGTIVWVNTSLKQGKNKYGWVFVPTDSTNYETATGEVELEVSAAEGVIFTGIKANYEQTISIPSNTTLDKLSDFGKLVVKETYSDGTESEIENYELSVEGDKLVAGSNVITVTYTYDDGDGAKDYKAEFTVFVIDEPEEKDPELEDISVNFSQTLNIPTGISISSIENYGNLVVKAVYDNGSEEDITTGYTLTGPEGGLKAGPNEITVTYTVGTGDEAKTYTKTFTIFVNDRYVTSITATYTPGSDIYVTTELDTLKANLSVIINYNDGTSNATPAAQTTYTLSVSGGKLVIGTNTIVVTYKTGNNSFKDTFEVTVVAQDPEIQSIEVTAAQKDVIYSSTKLEDLASKLDLTVTAENGDHDKSVLSASEYEITSFNAETGEVTVALKSNPEITDTFNVVVTPKAITKITVEYTQGITVIYPDYDILGLKDRVTVKVHYNDGSEAVKLANDDYSLAGNLAVGTSTIVVKHTADDGEVYTASFTVNVEAKPDGAKTETAIVWEGKTFAYDGNAHKPVAYYYIENRKYVVNLTVTVSAEAVNVGKYRATVDKSEVMDGYELKGDDYFDFEITAVEVEIIWSQNSTSYVYESGSAHSPKAEAYSIINDKKVKFEVKIAPKLGSSVNADGEAVDVGEYVAKVVITDGGNYKVVGDLEKPFEITPAKIDKQSVDTTKKFETLNAAISYVESQYNSDKVKVEGIENENGGFDITVSILDTDNYEWAGAEGGIKPVTVSFAYVAPVVPDNFVIGTTETIALCAVLAVAAVAAILAFIIALVKRKNKADDDGFYEPYYG